MSAGLSCVLVNAGETLLALPAQSLVSVLSAQAMDLTAANDLVSGYIPGGTAENPTEAQVVFSGEAMAGQEVTPTNSRCRVVKLRMPDSPETVAILARAHPLVVNVSAAAFRSLSDDDEVPEDGFLGAGMIGRRRVLMPDLSWWLEMSAGLATDQQAHSEGAPNKLSDAVANPA